MTLIARLKKRFYFVAAGYFRFFANSVLKRWRPRIIAITGSAGKTTMLNMVEFELGDRAHYSHDANSAFGIAFDLMGMDGIRGSKLKWILLFLVAPFKALGAKHSEEFYVVEIDGERPHEAEFLATWLKPEVTCWVSLGRSHAVQFEQVVKDGKFDNVDEAIANEFATLPRSTQKLVIIDGDNHEMERAVEGVDAEVEKIYFKDLVNYKVWPEGAEFVVKSGDKEDKFTFAEPQPREAATQVMILQRLARYLDIDLKNNFAGMKVAPGRSSYFTGIKGVNIIDCSYNAHMISMRSMLEMAKAMDVKPKWLVIGDIVDQGKMEGVEHTELARMLAEVGADKIILVGRRTGSYTALELENLEVKYESFAGPKEALQYLLEDITGGETIFFKGSQYLEWVIEKLLKNPADADKLPRREKAAVKRRKKWGLV